MKPWEIITAITQTKQDLDFSDKNIKEVYSQFKINKWLSTCNDAFIEVVCEINTKHDISDEQHYDFLRNVIPVCHVDVDWKLFKHIENLDEKKKSEDIRYISDFYEVGFNDAEMYYDMLSEKDLDKIKDCYRDGNNKIVKI